MRKISICFLLAMILILAACGAADRSPTELEAPAPAQPATAAPAAPSPTPSAPTSPAPAEADMIFAEAAAEEIVSFARAAEPSESPQEFRLRVEIEGLLERQDPDLTGDDTLPPLEYQELDLPDPTPTTDMSALQRMIIRSADMGISTYYFEETVTGIEDIAALRGGFIENSRQWMQPAAHDETVLVWRAEFVLRVPVGLFDQVNRELVALAQVRHFNASSQDVTMEFNNLTSRLQIREEEKRRLEVMLDMATDLTDIIRLESQLTTLQLAVDAYSRRLTEIDQLASFSTIRLTVYETVVIPEPEDEEYEEEEEEEYYPVYIDGFGTRFLAALNASLDFVVMVLTGIAMFFAWVGLPILLVGAIGFVVYWVLKKLGLWKRNTQAAS